GHCACEFDEQKSNECGTLVRLDRIHRVFRIIFHHVLRGVPAHIRGYRKERDHDEQGKTGLFQLVTIEGESDKQKCESNDRAENRQMIQPKMDMYQVHAGLTSI